jgi:VanW like protein/putative peptidoglycan binding protein
MLVAVLVMCCAGWVTAYAGATGKVPRGTSVAGVDIGGRDRVGAAQALTHGLDARLKTPIAVTVGTVTTEVAPADAGLRVDYAATIAKVLEPRSWDPRRLWGYYTGGKDITPVVDVDADRMEALLSLLDERAGQPARDAGLTLTGATITLTKPRDGAQLDHDQAATALVAAWTADQAAVTLPLLFTPPDIDDTDLQTAVQTLANPALSGPVTLAFAGSQVTLSPGQFADLISVVPRDGVLALDVNAEDLARLVDPAAQDTAPVDATIALQDGTPAVVPALAGQGYDAAGVAAAFLQAVTADGAARTVPVTGTETKAAFRTRDAKQLGVAEPVSSFTVSVPSTAGPSFADAAARLSGALLLPGDTFSFNARVGAASGSASRLATATWNAGFLAGLTDVARTGSPAYADGLPEGRDAMVDESTDLQMRNDSSYGVLLSAHVTAGSPGTPGSVVVEAWSTKEWDVAATTGLRYAVTPRGAVADPDPACVGSPGADGFAVDLVRSFSRVGDPTPVRADTVTTTYLPVPAVVCQVPPPV